jgi:predicted TPR repeat methyltransferase
MQTQITGRSCAWVLIATLAAAPAFAQEPARNPAVAEAVFREAQRLVGEGKVDEACAKFTESQHLDPQLGTLLNLAMCHEKQGRSATALA